MTSSASNRLCLRCCVRRLRSSLLCFCLLLLECYALPGLKTNNTHTHTHTRDNGERYDMAKHGRQHYNAEPRRRATRKAELYKCATAREREKRACTTPATNNAAYIIHTHTHAYATTYTRSQRAADVVGGTCHSLKTCAPLTQVRGT